jgi:hypothetical protein
LRIDQFRLERSGSDWRASARVTWEDSARPPFEVGFETPAEAGDRFEANPNAFLTACYFPAIRQREERVLVDGEICPRLAEGLLAAAHLLSEWWGPPRRTIPIEAVRRTASMPAGTPREALFLSAGVDSLALLHENRRTFPGGHPGAFADGLHITGLLFPGRRDSEVLKSHFSSELRVLGEIASDAGIGLVEVRTNLRDLETDQGFLADEWIGAALASAAHLFDSRWSGVTFASGRDIPHLQPRGTHPLLDPCFSTSATEIRHWGILHSRLEKIRQIADWEAAIRRLMVCFNAPVDWPNCGRCEKCVRTMAELAAVGLLEVATQFPEKRLRPDAIRALSLTALVEDYWSDLLPAFAARGESAIVAAIEDRLASARLAERWLAHGNWSGKLRRFDHRWLRGRLLALSRHVRQQRRAAG